MSTPDLAGYHAVHTALRRGTHALAEAAAEVDPADRRRSAAFARYWKGFAGEVLAHHTIEDDICFPALIERVPAAAELIGRTDADHHRLDELMTAATAQIEALSAGRPAPELASVLAELDELMDHHLAFEDADILPRFEEHFSGEEWDQLETRAQKHLGLGLQAAFSVPFVASMLDPDDLEEVFGTAPGAFKVLYRLTRKRHGRLASLALGAAAERVPAGR